MIDCGSLEYAHARLLARHGQRPIEAAWRRLESLREIAPLLDAARSTGLRPFLVGIGAETPVHQVEATLRGHWRALVEEVAAWMPAAWQPCIAWCAVWPDLAGLAHLARGAEPAPWMLDDALWRDLAAAPAAGRASELSAGPWGALAPAWPAPHTLAQAWRDEWLRRLPQAGGDEGAHGKPAGNPASDTLAQLVRTLSDHGHAFAHAHPSQGWLLRGALRARLTLLLRRATLEPAAAFIYLALCALDLERLRAQILPRLLFRRVSPARSA
jgi:hypothetical protein